MLSCKVFRCRGHLATPKIMYVALCEVRGNTLGRKYRVRSVNDVGIICSLYSRLVEWHVCIYTYKVCCNVHYSRTSDSKMNAALQYIFD